MTTMMNADVERFHVARKEHRCNLCPNPILPGERYSVSIAFPGVSHYNIGGGDYETVDYPFTAIKAHTACADSLWADEYGGYLDEMERHIRDDEAQVDG